MTMTNLFRHMKRCSTLLIVREMQNKSTKRCHLTRVRMAITEQSTNNKCGRGYGGLIFCSQETTHCVSRSVLLTLCDPMDCSPPGSSVHGILQARIPEWAAIPFSRGSSRPRSNPGLPHCRQIVLPAEPQPLGILYKSLIKFQDIMGITYNFKEKKSPALKHRQPKENSFLRAQESSNSSHLCWDVCGLSA